MSGAGSASAKIGALQEELAERLQKRRAEIERNVLTRVYAVSDPTEVGDPAYQEGLRAAVSAAVDFGLAAIQSSERNPPQMPPVLLVQARVAARSGVPLDTVLRRYFAGYVLLGDFLVEEAEGMLVGEELKRLLRLQGAVFDRLLSAIGEEHARESEGRAATAESHRAQLVRKLVDGERVDVGELAYELEASHLGIVAKGPGATDAIRELTSTLDRRLLVVPQAEGTVWAWLGGRSEIGCKEIAWLTDSRTSPEIHLAIGEPAAGEEGWRLTHRQARAALPIALRRPERKARYADVALLASISQDELLKTSLRRMYLMPIDEQADGGEVTREALRAYFTSGCNISAAAAASGLNRNTIAKRIRAIEEALGRPLASRAAECEVALRIDELDRSSAVAEA